jgi:hypothetical protein
MDRLTSVVFIMRGRTPFSHLGVLDLSDGVLSLRDAKEGRELFTVPVKTTAVRPARRKFYETKRPGLEVRANDRWWFLVPYTTPAKYQRPPTRALIERYHATELAPRPAGMSEEVYRRMASRPTSHQVLWAAHWMMALGRAGAAGA